MIDSNLTILQKKYHKLIAANNMTLKSLKNNFQVISSYKKMLHVLKLLTNPSSEDPLGSLKLSKKKA